MKLINSTKRTMATIYGYTEVPPIDLGGGVKTLGSLSFHYCCPSCGAHAVAIFNHKGFFETYYDKCYRCSAGLIFRTT